MRSDVAPKFGIKPFETTIAFNPMDAETGKEAAERRLAEAQTAKAYSDTGAIDGPDIRDKLIADEDSGYSNLAVVKPVGAEPRAVVEPNAPTTAPNTMPGQTPTPAPAVPGGGK